MKIDARTLAPRFGLGVVVVAAAALLAWQPPSNAFPDDGRTHLRYWYIVGANDAVPYHVRAFNAAQDSIVVHATPIPWTEHEKKILAGVLSGDPPDVVSQFVPVVKWASRHALQPLDGLIAASGFDTTQIFPALWAEMRYADRTFGVPINSASYALFYNQTLFAEAGLDPRRPPQTWDEVRTMARRLDRRDAQGRLAQAGFLPAYGTLQTPILMAYQQGVAFLSPDGATVRLDQPPVRDALQWMADYYRDLGFVESQAFVAGLGAGAQHGFLSGKLGMAILDLSFLDQLARFAPDLRYGVAPIPTFPGRPSASSAGSWWLGIPRGSPHRDAAWAFLQFAVSKQTQLDEVANTDDDLFPANRQAAADPRFLTDDTVRVFVAQMEVAHSPVIVPLAHDVFWREFQGAQERVLRGLQPPDVALRQAESLVQDALARARAYDTYVQATMPWDE